MKRYNFMKELETHENDNHQREEVKKINKVRKNFVDASKPYDYEYAKEFYLMEPHDNDLYNQN